jgi:lipoprotein-releasing system permease protein
VYELFLCIRYLRSKIANYFAVAVVFLCVWMMLISVSVMSGFLNKIESAAKGLFGDIVIEPAGERGLAWYDEFIDRIKVEVPDVQAADPFILSYGMLRVEGDPNYRQHVQLAGIRLPQRAEVTDFEKGLFVQAGFDRPTFDPPLKLVRRKVQAQTDLAHDVLQRDVPLDGSADLTPEQFNLLNKIKNATSLHREALANIDPAREFLPKLRELQAKLDDARQRGASETELLLIREEMDEVQRRAHFDPPDYRAILGLGIPGLSFKTDEGETIRYLVPGHRVILYVAPLGKGFSMTEITPNIRKFTIIDDCKTDVSSIDNKLVYLPFVTLQLLNNMAAEPANAENVDELIRPARCSQIHVKVRPRDSGEQDEAYLREVAAKINRVWLEFQQEKVESLPVALWPAQSDVGVETWRQRQYQVIGPIEKQRTLVIILFGIMSISAVVMVFVILYTVVVQKTREIGTLKAIGAGGGSIAKIFFLLGSIIGVLGATLGTAAGYFTVRYINEIQDWVDTQFGFRVWSKDQFMFEKIPNEVDWNAAVWIFIGAIFAGLIGALLPAVIAARQQPVKALRYE